METIAIDKDDLAELIAVTMWYDAMPEERSFSAGDRFHENIHDFQLSCINDDLPEDLTKQIEQDEQYISHLELEGDGDGILVIVCSVNDPETEVKYKLVPKT